jgi:hypothetical protein
MFTNDPRGDNGGKKDPRKPTRQQIIIWVVAGALGLYFIGSGLFGMLNH